MTLTVYRYPKCPQKVTVRSRTPVTITCPHPGNPRHTNDLMIPDEDE